MRSVYQGGVADGILSGVVPSGLAGMDVEISKREPSAQLLRASIQLGTISLFQYVGEGVHRACRRWQHIRDDGLDCYVVQLPRSASFTIGHGESMLKVDPGSFAIQSTTRPFQLIANSATNPCTPFESTHIWIPGPLLRSRIPQIEEICNSPFEIVRGASKIMITMVEAALQDGPALPPAHSVSFGNEILGAVVRAAETAYEIRGRVATVRETSLSRIFDRAVSFIETNLSDSSLGTTAVADHCRISVRYLHAAFERQGETVAALIRERRLQLCRQVLSNPNGYARSILQISNDWGFSDPAHFSHAYKTRFGITPSKERLNEESLMAKQRGS